MHFRAFDGNAKLLPFQLTPMDHSSQQFFFFCLVSDG